MRISRRIRRMRQARGLTLERLAQLSNLTKGYLSKVERSTEPPPVSTLQAIAVALGVDIADFFEKTSAPGVESDSLDIVRHHETGEEFISQSGYKYHPLVRHFRNKYMSPFLMTVEPGETEAFSHDSEEFCYVVEGSITFCYEDESHEFQTGDGFYFDSRKAHHYVNDSGRTVALLAVNFNYRRF